jgi:hypothetical protein
LGIAEDRVVLLPSWEMDGDSLISATGRDVWKRYRRFAAGAGPLPPGDDLSAGRWRRMFYPDHAMPAVHPQHERRKSICGGTLWRFAGFGRYGRAKWERACKLANAGFVPRPLLLQDGYLASEFVPGRPVDRDRATPDFQDRVRSYLGFIEQTFPQPETVPVAKIEEMVRVNVAEAMGPECEELAQAALRRASAGVAGRHTCAIDGRMLPHEWIETEGGYLKTDALDHHEDHFFPGCQSIAWDEAAARIELGLHFSRDLFHEIAYLSYRLGYCFMAAQSLSGSPESPRFEMLSHTYSTKLREVLKRD